MKGPKTEKSSACKVPPYAPPTESHRQTMIAEPITAGGGVLKPVPEYYPILQEILRKYNIRILRSKYAWSFGSYLDNRLEECNPL